MERFFFGLCVGAFLILMALRGAALQQERNELATRVEEQQRVITQLANRPTPAPLVVRVPAPAPVVVYAPAPGVQWPGLLVVGVAVAVLTLMVGAGRVQGGALHPGEPGFDEAVNRAASAAGGAVVRYEGAYWLMVPGREPERVRRLIEQKG